MTEEIKLHLNKIKNNIKSQIKKAHITMHSSDTSNYTCSQVSYYGKVTAVQTAFPYGFSASPPKGELALIVNIAGQEENQIAFPYSTKNRNKGLKLGEVAIGNPTTGAYIKFLADGSIEIVSKKDIIVNCANGNTTITATNTYIKGHTELGDSGEQIARKGDSVLVDGKTGTITGGGTNKSA